MPDGLVVSTAQAAGLPGNWRDSEAVTQAFGDRWLDTCADLRYGFPPMSSAEHNLLINALHPRLPEIAVMKERDPFEFDPRLA